LLRTALFIALVFLASASTFAGPLHQAAEKGDLAEASALLAKGADPNEQNENGETALTAAILERQDGLALLLLDRGARTDGRNAGGFTPLHAAAYVDATDIAALLLDRGAAIDDQENKAGVTPLSIAAEENRLQVAGLLLDRGANIEQTEMNGYTPLTRALWRGHADMVTLLQRYGAKCQPVEILEEPAYSECMAGQK
jgi:ankyrin repeat protein